MMQKYMYSSILIDWTFDANELLSNQISSPRHGFSLRLYLFHSFNGDADEKFLINMNGLCSTVRICLYSCRYV